MPSLPAEECSILEPLLQLHRYEIGEQIVTRGEAATQLYIVLEGELQVSREEVLGQTILLTRMCAGEIFGEVEFLAKIGRTVDVTAKTPATVAALSGAAFEEVRARIPYFVGRIEQLLAERVARLTQQIADVALLDVPERLMRLLRNSAHTLPDGTLVIDELPAQKELAQMLGATREVINRALRLLRESGEIATHGKRLVICRGTSSPAK